MEAISDLGWGALKILGVEQHLEISWKCLIWLIASKAGFSEVPRGVLGTFQAEKCPWRR